MVLIEANIWMTAEAMPKLMDGMVGRYTPEASLLLPYSI